MRASTIGPSSSSTSVTASSIVPSSASRSTSAHDLLCDVARGEGLDVSRGAYDLDTAFRGRGGPEGPTIVDLLRVRRAARDRPCLRPQRDRRGGPGCRPGGGGAGRRARRPGASSWARRRRRVAAARSSMIERGALDGVDAAMMVHPADSDLDSFRPSRSTSCTSTTGVEAAHAAAAPAPRSERPRCCGARLHGRGDAPSAHRGPRADPRDLHPRRRQAEHRAPSVGRDALVRPLGRPRIPGARSSHACSPPRGRSAGHGLHDDLRVVGALRRPGRRPGCSTPPTSPTWPTAVERSSTAERRPDFMGSTDMGNVSHVVPSIHPMIKVAPDGVAIHTPAVRRAHPGSRRRPGRASTGRSPWPAPPSTSGPIPVCSGGVRAEFERLPDRGRLRLVAWPAAPDRHSERSRRDRGRTPNLIGRDPLRVGGLQRRGAVHPPPVLHQPRPAGLRPGEPARGGEGRAVRPLLRGRRSRCDGCSSTSSWASSTWPAT